MIKAVLHGCCGKMGQTVTKMCEEDNDIKIIAGIDPAYDGKSLEGSYPIYKTIHDYRITHKETNADVVIDFSNASAIDPLLEFCLETKTPLVLCTTGLSKEQLMRIKKLSEKSAVLRSANMSLGINLLVKVLKDAVWTLANAGFDIEIVEKHHNQKVDAPSGTAIALADAMNETMGDSYKYVYDRTQKREKRSDHEIGISSVRGGTIVGDHDVIFAGTDEVITFSHMAYSKAVFAKGAIQAAKFLADKLVGLYTMSDVIND